MRIIGTGSALPKKVVTNEMIAEVEKEIALGVF